MLPVRHASAWLAASALLVIGLVIGSLGTGPNLPPLAGPDKLHHFAAYCFLAVWFGGLIARPHYWKIFVALACLGLALELLQFAMHRGRQGELLDMVANLTGVAAGLGLGAWLTGGWVLRVEAWLARS
jgi:VanZ family protein